MHVIATGTCRRLSCGPWWTWLSLGECITDHYVLCARLNKVNYWQSYANNLTRQPVGCSVASLGLWLEQDRCAVPDVE